MATPGIGTTVIYHRTFDDGSVDVPAWVLATHDSWASNGSNDLSGYPGTQPDSSHVYLVYPNLSGGLDGPTLSSEGTGNGQFSLLSIEAEDA